MKTTNWEEITLHKEEAEEKKKVKTQSKKVKEKCIIVKNKNRYLHVIYYIKTEKNFAKQGEKEVK